MIPTINQSTLIEFLIIAGIVTTAISTILIIIIIRMIKSIKKKIPPTEEQIKKVLEQT